MTRLRFLFRMGLAPLSALRRARAVIAKHDFEVHVLERLVYRQSCEIDALRAQNTNLVRAAAERAVEDEVGLPHTGDDPPPFGHTWERPDPRSGAGPITVIGG